MSDQKKQRKYYSGKKKRHTLKTQVTVDKKSKKIIATDFGSGKKHDFRLFKESKTKIHPEKQVNVDSGYQGMQDIHTKTQLPTKKNKKSFTKEQKKENKKKSSERVLNEHVIGKIKRFKIISDKYRNRRKRFCLRFNLIAGLYNFELESP